MLKHKFLKLKFSADIKRKNVTLFCTESLIVMNIVTPDTSILFSIFKNTAIFGSNTPRNASKGS